MPCPQLPLVAQSKPSSAVCGPSAFNPMSAFNDLAKCNAENAALRHNTLVLSPTERRLTRSDLSLMKLADFVSKLNMLDDTVGSLPAYFIGEMISWVVYGVIWLVGASLYFLVRNYPGFMGAAAISCGVLILVLVAWRTLKTNVKTLDDPGSNQLIGERKLREGSLW